MKVAIVHDWLNQMGGAEGVLEALVEAFPGSPVYTSMYWRDGMPPAYRRWDVRTTWMDHLPGIYRQHQPYVLLYPLAFGGLTLTGYDLVISNKSAFCLGVRVPPETVHVCYCLTPTRFVWQLDAYAERERVGGLAAGAVRLFLPWLQSWERAAAQRVTSFVSISGEVQARIQRLYGRQSAIIYPPVRTRQFAPAQERGEYFLILSRLVPYKRIDLAVEAFNQLGLPLWIAGEGRDKERLRAAAGPTIRFLGRVDDAEKARLLARCRALIFPGLEDFGITPVEAMGAGRPVIAYAEGGALDSVVDGVTGLLFSEQTTEALADAVRRFDEAAFEPDVIRAHAERFDESVFRDSLHAFIAEELHHAGRSRG